jgi:hypothetical protein
MSDTAGLYAIIGAAVGAVGTQLTGITQAIGKSRARKAKTTAAEMAERTTRRRPLYLNMLSDLDDAAQTVDWLIRTGQNPRSGPTGAAPALGDKLAILRQVAVDVQIDGSPRAKDIAARVLHGIGDIWQETTEGKAILASPHCRRLTRPSSRRTAR